MKNKIQPLLLSLVSKTPRGRMLRGIAANLYDKGAITFVQLLSIPVLTSQWGVEGYGIWLMLMTVPTYILLSDFGVGTAAGVEITKNVADGFLDDALDVFQSAWAFTSSVVAVVGIVAIFSAVFIFWGNNTILSGYDGSRIAMAIVCIVLYAATLTQMSILSVVFRATHKFALATMFSGSLVLLEGLSLVVSSMLGFDLLVAAASFVVIRLAGVIAFLWVLQRKESWVHLGINYAKRETFRRLIHPSLAALSLTLSNALAIQGAVLTLGWFAGPGTVAIFGAVRTLTRTPLQISGLVLRPSIPELTRAYVSSDWVLVKKLLTTNIASAVLTAGSFFTVFAFFGQFLLEIISKGNLEASTAIFILLSGAASANAVWMAVASPLVATNRQVLFAYWYLLLSLCVVATPALSQNYGLEALCAAILVSEAVILLRVAFLLGKRDIHTSYRAG